MKFVKQPYDSSLCGQACVAMLADVDLDTAIMVFRTKGRTRYKQLIQALRQLGVDSADSWKIGHPVGDAIIRFTSQSENRSHWVLWYGGKYYDPNAGVYRGLPNCIKYAKATSHLRVGPSAFQSSEAS